MLGWTLIESECYGSAAAEAWEIISKPLKGIIVSAAGHRRTPSGAVVSAWRAHVA